MHDLVSYNEKHNEANGEGGNDGENHNRSWNCGVEGETDDPAVLELRCRQQYNLMTTLLLSQGVPMLLHGDELGRTQQGNNNAYCQDNELAWIDWSSIDDQLLAFTSRVIALRAAHPVFRRRRFFTGASNSDGEPDIAWLRPDGEVMASEDWSKPTVRALAVFLNGSSITELSPRGEQVEDDSFLILLNPGPSPSTSRCRRARSARAGCRSWTPPMRWPARGWRLPSLSPAGRRQRSTT
jgi:glycogen operon protein